MSFVFIACTICALFAASSSSFSFVVVFLTLMVMIRKRLVLSYMRRFVCWCRFIHVFISAVVGRSRIMKKEKEEEETDRQRALIEEVKEDVCRCGPLFSPFSLHKRRGREIEGEKGKSREEVIGK